MHIGKFVFAQIIEFLPQRQFRRIVARYNDRTTSWSMSHWNHMLVLMFGQLMGCGSLRELTDLTIAHGRKSKHLGFGSQPVNRQILSRANFLRDHRIFEEFAFYMVSIAQSKRITKEFELHGRFYAIDSTTIDLCMAVFRWAEFRSTKSGIRIHTQIDIVTYCLIANIEHELKIGRPVFEVMRILGKSALTTDSIRDLFQPLEQKLDDKPDGQLFFEFIYD